MTKPSTNGEVNHDKLNLCNWSIKLNKDILN